jgi:membrane protease YdiL (CAAX protease family)
VNTLFLLLFAAYLFHSLWFLWRTRKGAQSPAGPLAYLLQGPLFVIAGIMAWRAGAIGRDLLHLAWMGAGLALGHFIFVLSIALTQQSMRDALSHARDLRGLFRFLKECPELMMRVFSVAFMEELIYRAAAQPLLMQISGSATAGIVLTAAVFAVVHDHFFRNPPLQSFEFFLFACILGVLYWATGSLIFTAMVHTARNLEISYLEFLLKREELGSETEAIAAVEGQHMRRRARTA